MLLKYLPILITSASFFIAITLHWAYKTSFFLPSFLSALASAVVSFICFKLIPITEASDQSMTAQIPWNAIGFAFSSGFILALLIGYLMKYAPTLFGKEG